MPAGYGKSDVVAEVVSAAPRKHGGFSFGKQAPYPCRRGPPRLQSPGVYCGGRRQSITWYSAGAFDKGWPTMWNCLSPALTGRAARHTMQVQLGCFCYAPLSNRMDTMKTAEADR